MSKSRLEAFTDAVIAIIMTILVLELKSPTSGDFLAVWNMKEQFLVYILSFFLLAIYWVNHHHLLSLVKRVNGRVLWANMIMLFWMTLIPFATAWVGLYINNVTPTILYGMLFLLTNISYAWLMNELIKENGEGSKVYNVYYKNKKMNLSIILSVLIIFLAFIKPIIVLFGCLLITSMWFIPSKKAEKCSK